MKVYSKLISGLFLIAALLSLHFNASAQKSQKTSIDKAGNDKSNQKTAKKPVKAEVPKPPPVVVKKVEPPPKKVIIQPRPKPVVKKVVAKTPKSKFIKVLFNAPETGLEVEVDRKSFYIKKDGSVEIPLTAGKHLIIVKRNGQQITDLLELTVNANLEDVDLSKYIKEFSEPAPEKVTVAEVEQKVQQPIKTPEPVEGNNPQIDQTFNKSVGLNIISQNVTSVFTRFYDAKQTDGVSLKDWTYVYQQTNQNEILPGYSREKINLVNKFAEGQINLLQLNYVQAINSFEGAVSNSLLLKDKLKENSPIPYYGLGLAYLASKDYKRAIDSYLRAIQIDSKFAVVYSRIGDALKASGRGKEALSYYLSAYKNGYKTFESGLNLANNLKLYESYYEASVIYQELGKEKPVFEIYLNLGDCFVELKQNIRALDSYRRAVEIDPKAPLGHLRLGNMYSESKDFQVAIEAWQKSLELDKEGKVINRKKVEEMIKKAKKRK
jgi:tetratricopeptide (TPR) repeat protein